MSMIDETNRLAGRLRELHLGADLLVVPNAFDAASGRILEQKGFPTVATSSAAMAWSAGGRDGEELSFSHALDLHTRVARAVGIPVSIDFEGGYLEGGMDIERTVDAVIDAGVAGLNLEDTDFAGAGVLKEASEHADMIAAARAAAERRGVALFLIGRTDLFFRGVGPAEERVAEAARRLKLYAEAGADCVFAPGIVDEGDIATLVGQLSVPLNVMYTPPGPPHVMFTPPSPPLSRLGELGVKRLTFGGYPYLTALSALESVAEALRKGDLGPLDRSMTLSGPALGAVAGMG